MSTIKNILTGEVTGTRIVDAEERLLTSGFDFAWVFNRLKSTMNEGRMLLARYEDAGPCRLGVVVAENQDSGRGRQGRGWVAAEHALSATFVSRIKGDVSKLQGVALAVGCAVAGALEGLGGAVGLKWPNDVLARGADGKWRKLGGILVEADSLHGGVSLSIGIGINLSGAPSQVETATDFEREFRRSIGALDLCCALGPQLRRVVERFSASNYGFETFRNEWTHRCMHIGYAIKIDRGNDIVEGSVRGISGTGALQVEIGNGSVVEVVSGHVLSLIPKGTTIGG